MSILCYFQTFLLLQLLASTNGTRCSLSREIRKNVSDLMKLRLPQ